MTVQSLITAELLLVSIFLCLYLHTHQRHQLVKLVQEWLKQGVLPATKVSGRWRVPAIAIAELERSGRLRGASRRLDQIHWTPGSSECCKIQRERHIVSRFALLDRRLLVACPPGCIFHFFVQI